MDKEKIELVEHMNIIQVSKNGIIKRYEISPESGYFIFRKDDNAIERGLLIYPAKSGIENIVKNLEVKANEQEDSDFKN